MAGLDDDGDAVGADGVVHRQGDLLRQPLLNLKAIMSLKLWPNLRERQRALLGADMMLVRGFVKFVPALARLLNPDLLQMLLKRPWARPGRNLEQITCTRAKIIVIG